MISCDNKAFQCVTLQTSTLFYNSITCFSSYTYNFVTVTVCKYMGAVNWCPYFSEFSIFSIRYHLGVRVGKVKRRKGSTLVHSRQRHSYKKQWNMMTSWVWRSLGRYFLINHCIILFEIMLISKNKFNTVFIFYCFPEHSSCCRIFLCIKASRSAMTYK